MGGLSDAAQRLEGQKMFQILARAKELERAGKSILHFEIGDPDFDTPRNVVNSAYDALNHSQTHYAPSGGILELKVAAAEVTSRSRGFKPDLDQLLVTPGANAQLFYAMACSANQGDEVIIPDPSFVSYNAIASFLGLKVVTVPLREENEFRLNPEDVRKAVSDKTKMIIINSPSNPTGSVMTPEEDEEIFNIARSTNAYLLSDEIYARMIYKDSKTKFSSPSRHDHCKERVIVVNGFSKSYAMTGWRLGVVTGPKEITKKMELLLETTSSCVSPFVQYAGVEALRGDQEPILKMVEEFRKRRDVVVRGLNELPGVRCLEPKGAFYAFPNITGTGLTSQQFADKMLNEAGVALCPGTIFGESGEGHVRICYANSMENIEIGLSRIDEALRERD